MIPSRFFGSQGIINWRYFNFIVIFILDLSSSSGVTASPDIDEEPEDETSDSDIISGVTDKSSFDILHGGVF